ncbi:MAG: phenylalanine--tRNA ligase subunit beta [Ignavibacteriales bacterium]|nr:MAG: phenylalanine--tRNA ligase subunit beta [Ignavibacteriales bacterium]
MKISLNWLKEYVDLSGLSTIEIVHTLTMIGLEVEDFVDQNELYKGFIVGQVKEKQKHPNADKLSLCIVNDGNNDFQVVCGAPNVATGQKIIFAPIGTEIPNGKFKITKAKIRGTESFGMICSDAELNLSDDHSGIRVLDENIIPGTSLIDALMLNDVLMEIGITPNRPDALSHIGIARDLSAFFNKELKYPDVNISKNITDKFGDTSIQILDSLNCPRYSAKIVTDITVGDSPQWLKDRITKIGLRPINNIVDATNYVMYEYGQPLHAFDLDLLKGKSIVVKQAEGSSFTTLDGKKRELNSSMLMICDSEREVAIAGVMGGENSEINSSTKNILIESAYFNPSSVRKTGKSLGLSTDASFRFERGTDPEKTVIVAERAAQIISNIAGGKIADCVIDIHPKPYQAKQIKLRFERIKRLLGFDIPKEKVLKIISGLEFPIIEPQNDYVKISVPGFRPDVEREVDVIEEIARINGYDNIPPVHKISISLGDRENEAQLTDELRNICTSLGLFEIINNPMQIESSSSITGSGIKIMNPLSLDMEYLRTSLIPGALSTIALNINRGEKNLNFFEIGNVFNRSNENELAAFSDFSEDTRLLLAITGLERLKTWHSTEKYYDLYSLKGLVESITAKISLDNVLIDSYYVNGNTIFDYYFEKKLIDKSVGMGGKISRQVLKKFDIQQDVFCFEFSLDELSNIKPALRTYSEPVKYPKVMRDFAFIFDTTIEYSEIKSFIKKNSTEILKQVELFDVFESESLGNAKKSLAFTLEYQSDSKTLTEEEVEKDFSSLINLITKKFNAKLRGR